MSSQTPRGPASVLVVGAGLAGLRTAEALRSLGHSGPLVLVGEEEHAPYDRPPLSKQVLTGQWDPARTALADAARLAELRLDLRLAQRATALRREPGHWRVDLQDGSGIAAPAVVLATGAAARTLPGQPASDRVHVLRGLDDALRLRAALRSGRHLLVVGAGLVGAEVAAVARGLGLSVTVLEAQSAPFVRAFGAPLGALLGTLLQEQGVELRCGVSLAELRDDGASVTAELQDGTALRADLALVSIGSVPSTGWLAGTLPLRSDGAVLCDSLGRTLGPDGKPLPGLWAVGDLSAWTDPATRSAIRVEHWTRAVEQAEAVAAEVLGRAAPPVGVPYVWSEQGPVRVQVLGEPGRADRVVQLRGEPGRARGGLFGCLRGDALVGVLGVDQRSVLRLRASVAAGVSEQALRATVAGLR